jgi:alkaline phosphatase D
MNYPLIDFTSSGMTHSYDTFKGESNPYRVSEVVSKKNFGILRIDLTNNLVKMEIRGENNALFQSYIQKY